MTGTPYKPHGLKGMMGALGTWCLLAITVTAIAGCTGNPLRASSLPPAPVGSVTGQQLPPPGAAGQQQGAYNQPGTFGQPQGQFPGQPVPGTDPNQQVPGQQTALATQQNTQTQAPATNSLQSFTPPATALAAADPGQLSGAWTISDPSGSCQLFLTNTTWTGGLRASTRGCASTELQGVSAWNTSGKEIVLKDLDSKEIARLARTADTQYQGVSASGSGVTFFR